MPFGQQRMHPRAQQFRQHILWPTRRANVQRHLHGRALLRGALRDLHDAAFGEDAQQIAFGQHASSRINCRAGGWNVLVARDPDAVD